MGKMDPSRLKIPMDSSNFNFFRNSNRYRHLFRSIEHDILATQVK